MLEKGLAWARGWAGNLGWSASAPTAVTPLPVPPATPVVPLSFRTAQGTHDGWLRVLNARELIELVQGERAMDAMWKQSKQSTLVWQRDFLPSLVNYAEFVQLMPASESHHHAHAGGLLAHTLEMVLAAMTWRNGHFLPEGAPVEQIDEQRDEWTYVIFFAALLHDIGKIMTDLRISWRNKGMDTALQWVPISGALPRIVGKKPDAQYMVEFTPKAARDYSAHSRLALLLLQQVAPPSALAFLAQQPAALQALSQYLVGQDKSSLVAKIVQKADQVSTQRALLSGSKARFTTSTSVPLIDLLMGAMGEMLKQGSYLPLNRSGASGWVYDGSVWFVAKRLADAVRLHIRQHAPDEAIPGDNKNDRLFDTWQEYGCILPNPATGQAIWYVCIEGKVSSTEVGEGDYTHSLSVLRFPLDKLYADPVHYPPEMAGRIEIKASRDKDNTENQTPEPVDEPAHRSVSPAPESSYDQAVDTNTTQPEPEEGSGGRKSKPEPPLKAPAFNKPKGNSVTPKIKAQASSVKYGAATQSKVIEDTSDTLPPVIPATKDQGGKGNTVNVPAKPTTLKTVRNHWPDFDEDDAFFIGESLSSSPARSPTKTQPKTSTGTSRAGQTLGIASIAVKNNSRPPVASGNAPAAQSTRPLLSKGSAPTVHGRTAPTEGKTLRQPPVVLTPYLPALPHEVADEQPEATETAIAFMTWLQQGLATRQLKHNETGALVHFVAEGMALVSPAIFKEYCAECCPDKAAAAHALQVQREVIKAGWHQSGPGKINILSYQVIGRGGVQVSKLSAVVLNNPDRWVTPVPPNNPVLKRIEAAAS